MATVKEEPEDNTEVAVNFHSYSRPTLTLRLPVHIKKTLRSYKLFSVSDFMLNGNLITAEQLHNVMHGLKLEDCKQILQAAEKEFDVSRIRDVYTFLTDKEIRDNEFFKICTACPQLDDLLNGGLRVGSLTEIYGPAGSGKTQFCLQLCINVQMPKSKCGLESEAVFVDCEHSFTTERLQEMASASAEHWFGGPVDLQSFLDKVHFQRCETADIFRNLVMFKMESFLNDHPQVRLVILDGIPFLMRYGYESDMFERTKMLHLIAHQLRSLACSKQVAIVITNQMTFRPTTETTVPALGKNWSGTCSTKISLQRHEDGDSNFKRTASIVKSPFTGPQIGIPFQITTRGIC